MQQVTMAHPYHNALMFCAVYVSRRTLAGGPQKKAQITLARLPKMFDHYFAVCKLQRCKEAHQVPVGEEELNIWDILVHQNNIILHCILHHLKAVMGTMRRNHG